LVGGFVFGLVGLFVCLFFGWLVGCLAIWLFGWLFNCLVRCLVCCFISSVGRLVSWLVFGCPVSYLNFQSFSQSLSQSVVRWVIHYPDSRPAIIQNLIYFEN